jgi:malate dehydrogenase (oxaloacetate-decarboxylating)
MCLKSNSEGRAGSIEDALKDTDICIAASRPGPGTIKKEWIASMANDAIMFATSNPLRGMPIIKSYLSGKASRYEK